MDTDGWILIAVAVVTVLFSIIGWLLSREITQLNDHVEKLYGMHEKDVAKLEELKLSIANNYHDRQSIRDLLADFKSYLSERFDRIESAVGIKRGG